MDGEQQSTDDMAFARAASSRPFAPLNRATLAIGSYLFVAALTVGILACIMRLWEADLEIPFCNKGDSLCAQAWMKSVQENGWFLHNPNLGAPWGSDLYDFPMTDNLHFAMVRFLSLFIDSPGLLFNFYVLLQFPLIACCAFFVLRRLEVSHLPAIVGAVLYAFIPFHLARCTSHVFLASYYLVPFEVLLMVRLGQGSSFGWPGGGWGRAAGYVPALILCFLIAGAGVYYAFFGCCLLLISGGFATLQGRGWQAFARACTLCLAITVSVLVHLTPQIEHQLKSGPNPQAIVRDPADAEFYGLKIAHLLLPVSGHRAQPLANLKDRYLAGGRLNNENRDASLGLVGSVGFLLLLLHALRLRTSSGSSRRQALDTLAIVNMGAILLGTIGGFGVLLSLLVTSLIRAYNRVCVFIAFFTLAGAAITIDPLARRLAHNRWSLLAFVPGMGLLLALGVWDQASPIYVPDYADLAAQHDRDAAFIRQVEEELPTGAMVFQLPFISYPEAPSFGKCQSYDQLKPYLLSHSLRWSFATFRGRPADTFMRMLSSFQPEEMMRVLVLLGYQGLLIDRFAYSDEAELLEEDLTTLLRQTAHASGDGRWSFYKLDGFKGELKEAISEEHWKQACRDLSRPVLPLFGDGFLAEEGPPDASFRWSQANSDLILFNSEGMARPVRLEFSAGRLTYEEVRLKLTYPTGKKTFPLGFGMQRFSLKLEAAPGFTLIRFECDGNPVANDSRNLVFQLANVTVLPNAVP